MGLLEDLDFLAETRTEGGMFISGVHGVNNCTGKHLRARLLVGERLNGDCLNRHD